MNISLESLSSKTKKLIQTRMASLPDVLPFSGEITIQCEKIPEDNRGVPGYKCRAFKDGEEISCTLTYTEISQSTLIRVGWNVSSVNTEDGTVTVRAHIIDDMWTGRRTNELIEADRVLLQLGPLEKVRSGCWKTREEKLEKTAPPSINDLLRENEELKRRIAELTKGS